MMPRVDPLPDRLPDEARPVVEEVGTPVLPPDRVSEDVEARWSIPARDAAHAAE